MLHIRRFSAPAGLAVLPFLAAGCGHSTSESFPGYVEGEFVYISAPVDGRLERLAVARGQQVAAGARLYELEGEDQQAARAEAAERLAGAEARVENLKRGKRSAEREMSAAQVEQAKADSTLADTVLVRDEELFKKGLIPELRLLQSRAGAKAKKARLVELAAQSQLAAQSIGRREEVTAAGNDAAAAAAVLGHADWRLAQRIGLAPSAALVQDTFYRPGEWVPATRPIVSLLPPGNIRLRFFLPESELAGLKIGEVVTVRCDGCPAGLAGRVSFISTEPEYTPPVLFSDENRTRLVYRVEATPDAKALSWLKPGLPIDAHRESAP
jgi:HlyD family secretion protein